MNKLSDSVDYLAEKVVTSLSEMFDDDKFYSHYIPSPLREALVVPIGEGPIGDDNLWLIEVEIETEGKWANEFKYVPLRHACRIISCTPPQPYPLDARRSL